MRRWVASLCLAAALGAAGCADDSKGRPAATIPVHYVYAASDSNGAAAAAGTLEIVYHPASDDDPGVMIASITGYWSIAAISDSVDAGWQAGEGVLEGGVYSDRGLEINLHPGVADRSTLLNGLFDGSLYGSFSGVWGDAGIGGVQRHGTYAAQKT